MSSTPRERKSYPGSGSTVARPPRSRKICRSRPVNFASKSFFIFLPIVLLGYYRLRVRTHKYRFLLAASWFFYMSWNPWFIWVILFTSIVDYVAGILIEQAKTERGRKSWLFLSLATNL